MSDDFWAFVRRTRRRLACGCVAGVGLSLLGLTLGASLQACSSGSSDSTGGKLVVLHTRVVVDTVAESEFETALGWRVRLSEARVSAGPFYYFDGAPPLVLRRPSNDWRFAQLLGIGVAHAHPGHYQAGNAMGQMLDSASIDLLGGGSDLPDGEGVSGTYRSARFTFATPSGKGAPALGGHVALAVGSADKDGETSRFFRAFADLSQIEKSAAQAHIDGCEFSEVDVASDGTVTVTVNPKIWFDLVDFTDAEAGSASAPADLPQGSQPQLAFVLGTTQLSAYKFAFTSP